MTRDTILFDINETVLNLSALKPKFEHVFGDESVLGLWFSSLLHSSTVCAVTGLKSDFASLASAMLTNIASRQNIDLAETDRDDILATLANLPAHEDIKSALTTLRKEGYRTVAFSNSSLALITKQIKNAGLENVFDDVISVEETGSFKPDPKVYHFVANRLAQPVSSLRLVATHDWDTHGAMSAGMLAAYINRTNTPYHPAYLKPSVIADDMNTLVEKILKDDESEQGQVEMDFGF